MVFLQSEDKSGLPTAQQAKEKKRKEKERLTWGPPGPAGGGAVRSQVPDAVRREGGKLGEVGE